MLDAHVGGKFRADGILVRLVADHNNARDPFRRHLAGDADNRKRSVYGLPAGHGDGIVEKDLEGDIDPGRNAGADG